MSASYSASRSASSALVACALGLSAALTTLAAFAVAPTPAAAQSNAEARLFFERGNQALQRADRARGRREQALLEEALAHYVQSLGIVRSKNAVYNAGVVLERLGRPTEAFGYFREYLDRYELSDESRAAGEGRVAALAPQVAILRVESDPPGATVYIDRLDLAPRGSAPIDIAVEPGSHTVVLRAAHHLEARREAVAVLGETTTISVALDPEPIELVVHSQDEDGTLEVDGQRMELGTLSLSPGQHRVRWLVPERPVVERLVVLVPGQVPEPLLLRAPTVERALLEIRADVASRVIVDGNEVAVGDHLELQLDPGAHELELLAPEREPLRLRIVLSAGERRSVNLSLPGEPAPRYGAAPAIMTGVALAAAAVGAGFAVAGSFAAADYDETGAQRDYDRAQTDYLVADIVGWGVGGAAGLTAIVLWATRRSSRNDEAPQREDDTLSLDVLAGPQGGFATLRVPFGGAR